MRDYTKIPYDNVMDITYLISMLRKGHVIVKILVNEKEKQIEELTSYGNDSQNISYYKVFGPATDMKNCIIVENLQPYYAYKDENRLQNSNGSFCTCDIDIESDGQDIIEIKDFEDNFYELPKEYFNGRTFQFSEINTSYSSEPFHYEFYLSQEKGEILANFGGPNEVDFVLDWMIAMGYYDGKERI